MELRRQDGEQRRVLELHQGGLDRHAPIKPPQGNGSSTAYFARTGRLTAGAARNGIMNNFDQTIVTALRRRAEEHPNRKAFSFIPAPEDSPDCITYSELNRKASLIAGRLAKVSEFGDRALLMVPQGLEFIVAFFGCLYAGRIAVPAFPPQGSRGLRRLQRIVADS